MAQFPAMPFWFDAYMLDCGHLSDAEHGRYLLVLKELWTAPKQRIPNDKKWLSRRFRRPVDLVESEIMPILSEFCECDGNWWRQSRLSDEMEYLLQKSRKQSARSKSRWNKEKAASRGNAPTPTPIQTPLNEENVKRPTNGSADHKVDFKKPLYDLGKEILGSRYGGLITDALKTKSEDEVMKLLKSSQGKHNPTAYFTGALVRSAKQRSIDLCRA